MFDLDGHFDIDHHEGEYSVYVKAYNIAIGPTTTSLAKAFEMKNICELEYAGGKNSALKISWNLWKEWSDEQ